LAAALRAAETRVAALETDVRELEADLYAASVLWGETEADNTSLHAQVLDPSTPLNPKP
jgi:transcription elongation GreA/GreB family factor